MDNQMPGVPGGSDPNGTTDPNAPVGGMPAVDPNAPVAPAPAEPVNPATEPIQPNPMGGGIGGTDTGMGGGQPPAGGVPAM